MQKLTRAALARNLKHVLDAPAAKTESLSQDDFSATPPERPEWAIGPFTQDSALTFHAENAGTDPTGTAWYSTSLINPSLAINDTVLVMAYRASPRKESLSSRIGLATLGPGDTWTDHGIIIYPTMDNELYGCEDPKLYRHDGRWLLFYNAIFPITHADRRRYPSPGFPVGKVGCDINLAISDDLTTWRKVGPIANHHTTRLWAKGAAIVRDPRGAPVRLSDGAFQMFLSEGCNGRMVVGRSTNMTEWRFEDCQYLDPATIDGRLHEVACAVAGHHGDDLILDFLYSDRDDQFAAGQALYSTTSPTRQKALSRGGTLAWGGLVRRDGNWLIAQGWDAPIGSPELYFYRA